MIELVEDKISKELNKCRMKNHLLMNVILVNRLLPMKSLKHRKLIEVRVRKILIHHLE